MKKMAVIEREIRENIEGEEKCKVVEESYASRGYHSISF